MAAAIVTQPFDTIKTRMQSNVPDPAAAAAAGAGAPQPYATTLSTARTIMAEGGE